MLSFERTGALEVAVAGAALLVIGCGSISVVSDGGSNSGAGGNIDIITGSGGMTAGTGGGIAGIGGTNGQGGAMAGTGGARAGTGGMTGAGGAVDGTGGAAPGTGGRMADAGVDRGCICPDVVAPVCGDDGMTYNNACLATCASATVSHTGACIVACTAVRGCCSMDSDCTGNQECAGMTCGPDGRANGVCKARPARNGGRCWTDADCATQNNNNTCTGAVICPCGSVCLRPDALGLCN